MGEAAAQLRRVAVTGGLGFIGSCLIRRLSRAGAVVLNIDLDTYAGDDRRLEEVAGPGGPITVRADVADPAIAGQLAEFRPDIVVHFAAETHVTRSEVDPAVFHRTNIAGTRNVLEAAVAAEPARFVHISTDEVYGSAEGTAFSEEDKEPGEGRATSAYARSKAVADDLALGFVDRLPLIVLRLANCYGPWQHPEKAIARWATRALRGLDLPVWGDGGYVRDWLHVEDACDAIETAVSVGEVGSVYNVAPESEPVPNLAVARAIAHAAGRDESSVVLTGYDRPQHDRRYAIDASRFRALGWVASTLLEEGLERTVSWYRENEIWWRDLIAEAESIYDDN